MTIRRKPMPITDLTGGLNYSKDPIYITDKESPDLIGVRFHEGKVKKSFGRTTFASLDTERVMEFYLYRQYDADEYQICCGVDHAYKYASATWTKISTDPGPVFTGTAVNMFFSTTFDDLYLVTNGKDYVQKWNGTTWATLTGNVTTKYLVPFYSRLVVGNTTESGTAYPSRLRWSIIGDPETWTGTGSGAIDILDTQSPISGLMVLGDRLFVFKEDSIWECYYIGGTDVFKVRKVVDKIGTVSPKTIVNVGGYIVFYGLDDIYVFDGTQAVPVGMNMIPYLFETVGKVVNNTTLDRAIAVYDSETNNYIIALPTIDNTEPNLIVCYDLNNKVFTKRTQVFSAIGSYSDRGGGTTWTAAVGTWTGGLWDIAWRAGTLPLGAPTILFGGITGTVTREDKLTKSTELLSWATKDYILGHNSRFVEFRFLAKGDPFQVSYSYDSGFSWIEEVTLTPSTMELSEVSHYVNMSKFKVRVRVRTVRDDFELAWIEPWYIQRARSL